MIKKEKKFIKNIFSSFVNNIKKLRMEKIHDKEILEYPIVVHNFYKKFGKIISTNKISFKVKKGSIHGFIGPNGSGKTTTIKSLIGAYIPTSGILEINGNKAGSKIANRLIGYIPERASFPKHLNSSAYLKSMGELSGLKAKLSKQKAFEILKELNLEKHANRKPITFSSGMQKKILLAQALITNPDILILDEPAANLDPTARKNLFDEIIKLRDEGKTILISSHILTELERIIDEVTFLYYGNILYTGNVENFTKKSSSLFVKTSNNKKLEKWLKTKKIKYGGNIQTEIFIKNMAIDKSQELIQQIKKMGLDVISFKINDLQVAYSSLILKEGINKNGNI